jgi:hypothetical protein
MQKLTVDVGVFLVGIRIKLHPFCFEVFIGRSGWVLSGTDDSERCRHNLKAFVD